MDKTKKMFLLFSIVLLGVLIVIFTWNGQEKENKVSTVRVAHLVNISGMPALVGLADGTFQQALGPKVKIERKSFNSGPEAIEALLAGEVDIAYIGAAPAVNAYLKSHGALSIISGAANAGAVVVVNKDAGINKVADLAGKRVAVPQFGSTQDILLRKVLSDAGLKAVAKGGNVQVVQAKNPDILALFARKQIDGALVPEPWGSMLLKNPQGKLLLDWNQVWRGGNYSTLVVVANKNFLEKHPELVEKWVQAQVLVTEKIKSNPEQAEKIINVELKKLTGKAIPNDIMHNAFLRVIPTYDPMKDSIQEFIQLSFAAGYLKTKADISGVFALNPLNKVLKERGLPLIK